MKIRTTVSINSRSDRFDDSINPVQYANIINLQFPDIGLNISGTISRNQSGKMGTIAVWRS